MNTDLSNTALSRRNFLRMLALGGTAGLMFKLGLDAGKRPEAVKQTRLLMGTVINLIVVSDDREMAQAAITATLDRMAALESALSRFRPDSQLSQLNRGGHLDRAGRPLLDLLELSRRLGKLSGGAFDVTVKPLVDLYQHHNATANAMPSDKMIRETLARVDYQKISVERDRVSFERPGMGITLDSIAKGYIVDAGVEVLRGRGFGDVLVEAGGDLLAAGQRGACTPWKIGVQSPRQAQGGLLASFGVENEAVATSGDYVRPFSADLRQHHILDPRSGYSAPELASATAFAPTAALADGLATTLMVLGPDRGLALLEQLPACEACLVSKNLDVVKSMG